MKEQITHFHLFCGLGGGAAGFNRGHARVGRMEAEFRCLGGIDSDAAAIKDFGRLAGVQGTVMDLFSREQYIDFHGHEPPACWREAQPEDIRRAAGGERPNIVFTSAPCKGFSGLLPQRTAITQKYQALNGLTLRGVWLTLEAWKDDPPEFILFENVPRIQHRGRPLLDQIVALLSSYGYAVAETVHDCGELGGMAQRRKRFLLVARHQDKVPPFLYEPEPRMLQSIGTLLGRMPLPGAPEAGPMHNLPRLQWRTWVRLAFVEAGKDWRSLERLRVNGDGTLSDYLILPRGGTPARVPDPRWRGHEYGQYGVRRWDEVSGAISGQSAVGGGRYAVADPRLGMRSDREHYRTGGHYGVLRWNSNSGAVTSAANYDNGFWSLADPRLEHNQDSATFEESSLPNPDDQVIAEIQAEDDTWHRPFTTLELAVLQGLAEPEEDLVLTGQSNRAWRERIGNAVPPPAAEAIARVMGETLLLARSGETFVLNAQPVWVRPLAQAVSVHNPYQAFFS